MKLKLTLTKVISKLAAIWIGFMVLNYISMYLYNIMIKEGKSKLYLFLNYPYLSLKYNFKPVPENMF